MPAFGDALCTAQIERVRRRLRAYCRDAAWPDGDFAAGGDQTAFRVPITSAGPLTIDVELRYQPIAFRWVHNLEKDDADEPKRFLSYYRATSSGSPVVVRRATARFKTVALQ